MQNRAELPNFNRFSIWGKSPEELAAIKEAILKRKAEIETEENAKRGTEELKTQGETIFLPEFAYDYKQIAIYSAFFARDQNEAIKYASKYHAFTTDRVKNSLLKTYEHGVACNLLGNADLMTGGSSSSTLFTNADSIFKSLATLKPEEYEELIKDPIFCIQLLVEKAFALKYIGLAYHRKAMYAEGKTFQENSTSHHAALKAFRNAEELFDQADFIQSDKQVSQALRLPIIIDTMEIAHLIGVRFKAFNDYDKAEFYLNNALAKEKIFNNAFKTTHFLTYVTQQSLGELYTLQKTFGSAYHILSDTLKSQIANNAGSREHVDIAKTLYFIGMNDAAQKNWELAVKAHLEALEIKEKLLKPNDRMIYASISQLVIAYNGLVTYDWNNWRSESTAEKMYEVGEFIDSFPSGVIDSVAIDAYRQLNYKLGTYYLHVLSDFAKARVFLLNAEANKKDLLSIWAKSHAILCYREEILLLNIKIHVAEEDQESAMHDVNTDLEDYRIKVGDAATNALNSCDLVIKMLMSQMLQSTTVNGPSYAVLTSFVYSVKGLIFEVLGQKDPAINNLSYSVEVDADFHGGDNTRKVMHQLAVLYDQKKQDRLAQETYEKLSYHYRLHIDEQRRHFNPGSKHESDFHYNYGTYLERKGMLSDALAEFLLAYDYYEGNEIIPETGSELLIRTEALREKIDKRATISAGVTSSSVAQVPGTMFARSSMAAAVVATPAATSTSSMQP